MFDMIYFVRDGFLFNAIYNLLYLEAMLGPAMNLGKRFPYPLREFAFSTTSINEFFCGYRNAKKNTLDFVGSLTHIMSKNGFRVVKRDNLERPALKFFKHE